MDRVMHDDLVQGTEAWKEFRLQHDGASEASAVLGLASKTGYLELLWLKHTGISKEFSDWVQKNVLDKGHAVEALARPIAEEIIGNELYAETFSYGKLSASCDGITIDGTTAFEHKQWENGLAAAVGRGELPDEHQPQCQQIMHVTGAERLLFCVSNGTRDQFVSVWVYPDAAWVERIVRGWAQFHKDLETYVPPVVLAPVVAAPVKALPTLFVQARGEVTHSNYQEFAVELAERIAEVNLQPKTDQEFADGKLIAKNLRTLIISLRDSEANMLAQTQTIGEMCSGIAFQIDLCAKTALALEKAVNAEEAARKWRLIKAGKDALAEHVAAHNKRLGAILMPSIGADFASSIKGKSLLSSMENGIAATLANAKVLADTWAALIAENLAVIDATPDLSFMFRDRSSLCLKDHEAVKAIVENRIATHKTAEATRIEADRIRITAEVEARAVATATALADRLAAEEQAIADTVSANAQDQAQADAEVIASKQACADAQKQPVASVAPISTPVAATQAQSVVHILNLIADLTGKMSLPGLLEVLELCQSIERRVLTD